MKTYSISLTIAAATLLVAGSASAQTGRYIGNLGIAEPTIAAGHAEGKMDNKPYSASYLPRVEGPLSKEHDTEIEDQIEHGFGDCDLVHQIVKDNAKKSATGKFDTAATNAEGHNPNLTDEYNRDGVNPQAEGWEGFCHQWSPAGLDPSSAFIVSMDKIYANVPFGIGDLRELTTWTYQDSDAIFIGKRNNGDKKDSENLDPMDLLGTFQAFVGSGKPGVVLDIDPGTQVWNQPFYSYSTDTKELSGDDAKGGPRGAKHAYEVAMTATYAREGQFAYRGDTYLQDLNWKFKVWTDKNGKVMKSAWEKDASDRIPDFAWVPNVKNHNENFKRLEKIAKEGVSVKDIQAFCEGMQKLTKDNYQTEGKKLADILNNICPVLDQNHLADYIAKTAARTGIDASVLEGVIEGDGGNS
ncbi:MAG TPA: hypothetical protein VMV18_01770 [bacterium]|nr:hypothetical protein [bacterium]